LIENLARKGFVDGSFEKHFRFTSDSKQISRLKAKKDLRELNCLFQKKQVTGAKKVVLRARNKESESAVLKKCGISYI
jgi:hypothetical protein